MNTNNSSSIEDKTEKELVGDVGTAVIGTPSGLKSQVAQAELTRRLIISIKSLDETTSFYSTIIVILTMVLGILAVFQIWLALKQMEYTEIQSRSERILQAQAIQKAVRLCEQSPDLLESSLFEVSTGKPAPCSQVIQQYK